MNLEHCIDASLQRHESQKAFGLSNYLCQEKVFSGRVPPSTQTRFNPWGQAASGGISATALNVTGQRLDATGLLYYHARYYNPVLGRFASADTIVPGNASGSVEGVALKGLTVDFHAPGFVSSLSKEHQQDFWFRLSEDDKKQAGSPWGPANPQSLNRYSYVLNGPVRWTDPSGHWVLSFGFIIRAGAYLGGSFSAGVTFDGEGNVAVYRTTTKGATIGATIGASGGGTLLPNTPTIDKTVGKGFNIGLSLPTEPGMGGDFGFDTRKENPAYSFSVGIGAGADIHIEKTDTTLKARNLPQRIYSEVVNRVIRYAMPSDIPY